MRSWMRFVSLLVALGLLQPAVGHARFIIFHYDVRVEWITYDFIGWVRVAEVLERPSPTRNSARVRLKVIERLKGGKANALELVYPDEYVVPGKEDQVISLGGEQLWHENVDGEFLVFLVKRGDGAYEANEGHYFLVKEGWLSGLPQEYQEYFQVPRNPRITQFMANARAKEPHADVKVGRPWLATPWRQGFHRMETPRERIELFIKALLENRSQEVEQMLYRTKSYGTPDFITHDEERTGLEKLRVVREAVYGDHAMVELLPEGKGGDPETFYLLGEKSRWRLLSPGPLSDAERAEVERLKRDEAFSVIKATLRKESSQH